nr:hypothetical protein CFP56_31532 [Quercus suber]
MPQQYFHLAQSSDVCLAMRSAVFRPDGLGTSRAAWIRGVFRISSTRQDQQSVMSKERISGEALFGDSLGSGCHWRNSACGTFSLKSDCEKAITILSVRQSWHVLERCRNTYRL